MKLKIVSIAIAVICLIAVCTGCSAKTVSSQTAAPSSSPTEAATASAEQSTATPSASPSEEPAASASLEQSASPAAADVDYSAYTGSWLCKAQTTSMEIEVDAQGNVQGSITTVVGSHVPSSLITGTIKDGVLTSKISSDDTIPGTLILSFKDPNVITANLKLRMHEDDFTLAEGDMTFERYTQE